MERKGEKLYGIFNNESELQDQIHVLKTQGFSDEDMYVVANHDDQISMVQGSTEIDSNTDDGHWWGKFKSFILGEDTVDEAITNMGFDDQEREHYQSEVKNGKILLYVDREYGNHLNSDTQPGVYDDRQEDSNNQNEDAEERIELHQEKLDADKKRVQSGEVNVNKHVEEEEHTIEVPVEYEKVYVERHPVNRKTESSTVDDSAPIDIHQEDGAIHIPVHEEQVDVKKKNVVTEEVVIGKEKVHDTKKITKNVQREVADIDHTTHSPHGKK